MTHVFSATPERDAAAAHGPRLSAGRRVLDGLFGSREARWLAPLLAPYRWPLGALFGLSLGSAGVALVPPWLTKLVIDRGLMAGDKSTLVFYVALLFAAGLAALGLGAVNSLVHLRFSARLLADLRRAAITRILAQSPRWQARQKVGELMSRLDGDAGEVQQFAFAALVSGAGSLLRLAGGLVMLFVLAPKLAMLALALVPFELVFFAKARPVTHARARDVRSARGVLASGLAETITGLGALRALNATGSAAERIETRQQDLIRALMSAQVWGEATRAVPMVLTAIVRGAVFLFGGLAVIDGTMPLGSLIAFTAYLGFLIGPMQSLISLWHGQARMKAAIDRLDEIMSAVPEVRDPVRPRLLPEGGGAIRMEAVACGSAAAPILAGVHLDIAAGTKVRLDGASGIGKSTLLSLLQRQDDPVDGQIRLDGTCVRDLSLRDLRTAVALVPQKGHVFSGTLGQNLRLGAADASEDAMTDALRLVELAARFPDQDGRRGDGGARTVDLDAPLGEGGLDISGGERQRLCLARALLTPFRVLVLDESLSEVDGPCVGRIMARIDERFSDRTRIIVTHGEPSRYGAFDAVIDLAAFAIAHGDRK